MILWLIKMYQERKEERALEHRKFALMQYSKIFRSPSQQYTEGSWKSILIAKSDISRPIDSEHDSNVPSHHLIQKASAGKILIEHNIIFAMP